jgi:hypothetical protein
MLDQVNAQEIVDKALPTKYHWIAVIISTIISFSPYIGRGYHALVMGGGIRGICSAIWLGTNVTKDLKADVANTKQAVVSGNTEFLTKEDVKT